MITGIVLAAGRSSRLGRPKQLLMLGGEALIRQTVQRVLATSLDDVAVVVGREAEAVRAAIADLPVRIVENPAAMKGQSTSVRVGLAALPPKTEAAVFLLGDQPGVDPSVIDALIAAWRDSRAAVVAPRYRYGLGNPVLFDSRVFSELAALTGDTGARPVVLAHQIAGDLHEVPIRQLAPLDVDTDEDYAALVNSWQMQSRPARPEGQNSKRVPLSHRNGRLPPPVEGGSGGSRGRG